jgi:DNA-binding response OmpR family regulator
LLRNAPRTEVLVDAEHRVLILEDETLLRRSLARLLERRGHRVVSAGSIAEARKLLREWRVDAAILDVGLPDGNGLDLLPLTRIDRSLVVSAEVSRERLEARGVAHFLRKPLDLGTVARQIDELVTTCE